ncbi:MAG TPA: nuclear transport factor 2 family protein [Pyrinomonadaceae bacterium]|nr:nuclear transport factor 2 family protein [Pyrinomonadaceae bacterium]
MSKCFWGLLLIAVIVGAAQAQKVSREEADVRAAIGRWADAVKDRDQKALDALFAEDLFITDYNGATRGKKEELEVLKPSETMKTISVTNDNIVVRIYNKSKTAVVTAVVKMVFEIGGKQTSMAMRYTSVWEKRKGNWQIVVLQTERVAPAKT